MPSSCAPVGRCAARRMPCARRGCARPPRRGGSRAPRRVRGRASVTLRPVLGVGARGGRRGRSSAEDGQQPVARRPGWRSAATARGRAGGGLGGARLRSPARSDSMKPHQAEQAPGRGRPPAPSASASPSLKMSSSGSISPASAGSSSSCSARAGSANPSRASGRAGTRRARGTASSTRAAGAGAPHRPRQVALELEPGDLAAVVVPLGALVAQEEVEDVLAEGLGDQLAAPPSRGSPRRATVGSGSMPIAWRSASVRPHTSSSASGGSS